MYDTAKKSRAANKAKAERLANRPVERVDSSDWTPPPLLNADVKTGMRPVSKQALKRGGKVHGDKTKARADRVARKAGGRVETNGEQPLVDRYVNRDLKKANEYRDGKKHEGALKHGGRAKKADGGEMTMEEMIRRNPAPEKKSEFKMPNPVPVPPRRQEEAPKFKKDTDLNTQSYKKGGSAKLAKGTKNARAKHAAGGKVHSDVAEDKKLVKSMVKSSALRDAKCGGGRMKKEGGGAAGPDPRLALVSPKALNFAQNMVTPGLKKGGRAKKADGGGLARAAGVAAAPAMAPIAMAADRPPANIPPVSSGLMPQPGVMANPGPVYDPAKYDTTSEAYKAAHPNDPTKRGILGRWRTDNPTTPPATPPTRIPGADYLDHTGNYDPRIGRASGGRAKGKGKGKTNINIVIAQSPKQPADQAAAGAPPMPPMPPKGMPVAVPPPAAGGMSPMGGGMPPMPPAGAGAPPAMPPMPPMARKAGGRITKVAHSFKDMEAGAGSGEGRLQKTDIAKRMPRKAGGKVYRSYKDMDAGAGSGFGRLEKTEIESKKSRKG